MRAALFALSLFLAGPLVAQEPVATARDTVRANVAIARSDLRNLVVAQEAFYSDHGRYSASLDSLRFIASEGGSIAFLLVRNNAWSAMVKWERLVGNCVVFVNLPQAERPKTTRDGIVPSEGEPRCDSQPELSAAASAPTNLRPPLR